MKLRHPILFLATFAAVFAAGAPTKSAPKKKAAVSKRKTKSGASSRQLTPTPERYKEIQQALASKGYLKSEPTGVWNTESSDALRQFQTDQKLSPSGKINASSLIGLGLGPPTAGPATGSVPPR